MLPTESVSVELRVQSINQPGTNPNHQASNNLYIDDAGDVNDVGDINDFEDDRQAESETTQKTETAVCVRALFGPYDNVKQLGRDYQNICKK